jgi:hypothetical protein
VAALYMQSTGAQALAYEGEPTAINKWQRTQNQLKRTLQGESVVNSWKFATMYNLHYIFLLLAAAPTYYEWTMIIVSKALW